MNVLLVHGGATDQGTTALAVREIAGALEEEGIQARVIWLGNAPIRDCTACNRCEGGHCVFDDDPVNRFIDEAKKADGFVFATPVYYAHAAGKVLSFMDRVFYAGSESLYGKPAAAVAVCRRAGAVQALQDIEKYFTINGMPVVSSTYWNLAYGLKGDEVKEDGEGMQTMRNLGRNMAWILKCIEAGKEKGIQLPVPEQGHHTNFMR